MAEIEVFMGGMKYRLRLGFTDRPLFSPGCFSLSPLFCASCLQMKAVFSLGSAKRGVVMFLVGGCVMGWKEDTVKISSFLFVWADI